MLRVALGMFARPSVSEQKPTSLPALKTAQLYLSIQETVTLRGIIRLYF